MVYYIAMKLQIYYQGDVKARCCLHVFVAHELRRRQENNWLNFIVSSSNVAAAYEAALYSTKYRAA